ncbi:hypothetical protein A4X13_0g4915 [Tilletia indica]|uniref:UNC-45/Cro1/She4 central domain-containing protein n=1 Tax=Tilletia indica TaxID=43049 RepID=A0A8T8SXB4_9BASI|nr:hypothetical protein A4X13_0g4915 [Tilletia indica]
MQDEEVEINSSAFSATASDAEHATALISLAQQLNSSHRIPAYNHILTHHLNSNPQQRITALNFLAAAALVHPPSAHQLVLDPDNGLLPSCIHTAEAHTHDDVAIHLAAMLAALADYPPSRSELAGPRAHQLHQWALTAIKNASHAQDHAQERRHTALFAGLLLLKLASPSPSAASGLDPAQASKRRQEASALAPELYALAAQETISRSSSAPQPLNRTARSTLLAALETLAYLSIFNTDSVPAKENFKSQIASSPTLLKALIQLAKSAGSQAQDSAVQFTIASIFEHVSVYPALLSSEQKQVEKLRKVAVQKQREAERKAAGGDGATSTSAAATEGEGDDLKTQQAEAESRCTLLLQAGVVSALVSMSTSLASLRAQPASSTGTNEDVTQTAPPLQISLSATLAALTMRQNRRTRGLIAQQGGAKTLLMLSDRELERYRSNVASQLRRQRRPAIQSSSDVPLEGRGEKNELAEPLNIVPLQALARMCISLDPQLLFGKSTSSSGGGGTASGPIVAIPALCTLFLHPSVESNTLARFEASLALTNLASVNPDLAFQIGAFSLDTLIPPTQQGSKEDTSSVLDVLGGRIFTEDNLMTRRAYIELLCNLVQCEPAFRIWTGEAEDDDVSPSSTTAGGAEAQQRPLRSAQQGLHILAALCAPSDVPAQQSDEAGQPPRETSLPTRLAASGTLATLCSSPSACERILSLSMRSLNTLARLVASVRPRAPARFTELVDEADQQEEDDDDKTAVEHQQGEGGRGDGSRVEVDEGEDGWTMNDAEEVELLEAEDADLESFRPPSADDTPAPAPAPKLAQVQLAIRGATMMNSLVQYLCWRKQVGPSQGGQQQPQPTGGRRKSVEQLARRFERSGALDALREEIMNGMQELKIEEASGGRGAARSAQEVIGMRREVIKLCLESLKAWATLGIESE